MESKSFQPSNFSHKRRRKKVIIWRKDSFNVVDSLKDYEKVPGGIEDGGAESTLEHIGHYWTDEYLYYDCEKIHFTPYN